MRHVGVDADENADVDANVELDVDVDADADVDEGVVRLLLRTALTHGDNHLGEGIHDTTAAQTVLEAAARTVEGQRGQCSR
jgi:hypothetical protein